MSRLDLVVGPNGAGKSTFVRLILAPILPASVFVNADVIAGQRWPEDPELHAYEAAEIAAATRERLMDLGHPFIAETVFSHSSKLELVEHARGAGYVVAVHALLVPVELCVHRVAARVVSGGHAVPEEKVRSRYDRLWPLVADAIEMADTATVWDNSGIIGPKQVALFGRGLAVGATSWPSWTPPVLVRRFP